MSIYEQVNADMKDALRGREKLRLSTLRSIRAAFLNHMKQDGADAVSDEDCVALLRRLEKQRRESIEAFEGAGRAEQAAAERAERDVILAYLPSLADDATTRRWLGEAIDATGAAGPGDLGRVMGALMAAHRGEVDGSRARELAQELLAA